jgi:hypothetical protein
MAELSANDIIRISTSIAPQGLVRRETGRTLYLTQSDDITLEDRVKVYTSLSGVAEDFATTSDVYKAAQVYFSQSPYPRNFLVGRHNEAVTSAILEGSSTDVDTTLATWNAISDGEFAITVDGTPQDVTGLDFSLDASMTEIAAAIDAGLSGASCAWDTDHFLITSATTGASSTLTVTSAVSGGAGTDISSLMGTEDGDAGLVLGQGGVAETIAESLDAIVAVDPSFTFVCEDTNMKDTDKVKDIAAWCLANRVYIASSNSAQSNVLTATAGTIFNDLYVAQNGNAMGVWSATNDYKHVSAAARFSSVNFTQANSLITLNMKVLPTCTPDGLTTTQVQKLGEQNVNRYVTRSGVPMFENGKTFSNDWWADTKYWTIWFENACLTAIFNLLYGSAKVPQTETGMTILKSAIERICEEGVRNGGIAAGKLNDAVTNDIRQTTGNESFDGLLPTGYFVYSEPMANQDPSDRTQRKATPIKVWLKGSGAIQEVDISVVFEQ